MDRRMVRREEVEKSVQPRISKRVEPDCRIERKVLKTIMVNTVSYLHPIMGEREEDSRGDTPGRVRQGEGRVAGAQVGEEGEEEGGEKEGE